MRRGGRSADCLPYFWPPRHRLSPEQDRRLPHPQLTTATVLQSPEARDHRCCHLTLVQSGHMRTAAGLRPFCHRSECPAPWHQAGEEIGRPTASVRIAPRQASQTVSFPVSPHIKGDPCPSGWVRDPQTLTGRTVVREQIPWFLAAGADLKGVHRNSSHSKLPPAGRHLHRFIRLRLAASPVQDCFLCVACRSRPEHCHRERERRRRLDDSRARA